MFAVDNSLDVRRGHAGVHLAVHHHSRGQAAGAYAAHGFQAEIKVGSGLPQFDMQGAFQFSGHLFRAAHKTGRAHAHLDFAAALGLGGKIRVKTDDAVNFGRGHAQFIGNEQNHFIGQIAENALRFVEHLDQGRFFVFKIGHVAFQRLKILVSKLWGRHQILQKRK